MLKLENHIELPARGIRDKNCLLNPYARAFSHCHQGIHGQDTFVHLVQIQVQAWSVAGSGGSEAAGHLGTVRQSVRLGDHADHIHTKSVDSLFTPPVHHVKDFIAHRGIVPIQIGLLTGEEMQIVLSACFVPFPCRASEGRRPSVWGIPLAVSITPDIIIPFRIIPAAAALHEPGMLIRGVVHDKIHYDPNSTGMGFRQHPVKIFHSAELRIDRPIITDIVTVIISGRLINGREPQYIHAKFLKIIQF